MIWVWACMHGQGSCGVFLDNTLLSDSASFHQGVNIQLYWWIVGTIHPSLPGLCRMLSVFFWSQVQSKLYLLIYIAGVLGENSCMDCALVSGFAADWSLNDKPQYFTGEWQCMYWKPDLSEGPIYQMVLWVSEWTNLDCIINQKTVHGAWSPPGGIKVIGVIVGNVKKNPNFALKGTRILLCRCGSNSFSSLRGTNNNNYSKTKLHCSSQHFIGFSTLKGTTITLTVTAFIFRF